MGKMKDLHLDYSKQIESEMDRIAAKFGALNLNLADYIEFLLDVYEQSTLERFEAVIVEYADELAWNEENEAAKAKPFTVEIDFEDSLLLRYTDYFMFTKALNEAITKGAHIDNWISDGGYYYLMVEKKDVLYLDEMESCSLDVLAELSKAGVKE